MKGYLWWSGGLVILIVVLISFAGGLYQKNMACQRFYDEFGTPSSAPETTTTTVVPGWEIAASCHGVENSLYVSYYFIALGVALIASGFIRR